MVIVNNSYHRHSRPAAATAAGGVASTTVPHTARGGQASFCQRVRWWHSSGEHPIAEPSRDAHI